MSFFISLFLSLSLSCSHSRNISLSVCLSSSLLFRDTPEPPQKRLQAHGSLFLNLIPPSHTHPHTHAHTHTHMDALLFHTPNKPLAAFQKILHFVRSDSPYSVTRVHII